MFVAKRKDGTIVAKGDILRSFRNEEWVFQSVTHPRKVHVIWDNDPNGEPFWPNRASMEYYASVFDLGIWDTDHQEWSFAPSWDNS